MPVVHCVNGRLMIPLKSKFVEKINTNCKTITLTLLYRTFTVPVLQSVLKYRSSHWIFVIFMRKPASFCRFLNSFMDQTVKREEEHISLKRTLAGKPNEVKQVQQFMAHVETENGKSLIVWPIQTQLITSDLLNWLPFTR